MNLLIRLIAQYAIWIYILCGLGMIFYLRAALQSRKEGIYAIFAMERAHFARQIYRHSAMILVLLGIAVGIYVLVHYVPLPEPSPVIVDSPSPTVSLSPTATVRPSPTAVSLTPSPSLTPTRRPQATPTATVRSSDAPPVPTARPASASCPNPNIQVTQPIANQVIDQGIEAFGTALKEQFDRYEFKFQSRDFQDEWHWVQTFNQPVEKGSLGFWSTAHLPAGNYRFMLIVIDRMGNSEECIVPVTIRH